MSLSVKTRNVIIGVCVAVVALFVTGYLIGHRKAVLAANATITALSTEINRTTVELNNAKLYVTSVEQEITTLRLAKAAGDLTNKELNKLNLSQVNELTRLTLMIDTLLNNVDNGGTVVVIHDTVGNIPQNAIKLPFTFDKTDKWLKLKGSFDNEGKLDIALKMDAAIGVYTGIDSKTKLPIAKLTSDNPYFGVLTVSSIKMDTQKPKKYSIGVMVGYGLVIKKEPQLAPFVGIGVTRSVIRF